MNVRDLINRLPEGSNGETTLRALYPEEFQIYDAENWFEKEILEKISLITQTNQNINFYFENQEIFWIENNTFFVNPHLLDKCLNKYKSGLTSDKTLEIFKNVIRKKYNLTIDKTLIEYSFIETSSF